MVRSQRPRSQFSSLSIAFATVGVLCWAGVACAQEAPPAGGASSAGAVQVELTEEARVVIREGVEWLAKNQLAQSGRWVSRPPRYQMSVTALAGLALTAHGVSLDRGPHARVLRRAVGWVLENQHREGSFVGLLCDSRDVMGASARPMHGHGFALLFLTQVYGSGHDAELRTRIARAIRAGVRLTERTISRNGGWLYWPRSDRGDEASVTVTQIQALRAARNCGFAVDRSVLDRALRYIRESQADSGGIRYQRSGGASSPALTAAGIVVFQDAGTYYDTAIEKAYRYLRLNMKVRDPKEEKWFFYTHLYVSQAMFNRGGPAWRRYFPEIRETLINSRLNNHWEKGRAQLGPAYETAIALLILQLPDRLLPIYQR